VVATTHKVPKRILSNRGLQFASKFIKDLIKVSSIKRTLSIAYHSQTNSQTEQINQEVEMFLWHYINYQQNDWAEWLSVVEFQYNDKKHTATGYTSFKLNFEQYLWKENFTIKT